MRALLFAILLAFAGCPGCQKTPASASASGNSEIDVLVVLLAQQYDQCIHGNIPLVIEDTFSIDMLRGGDRSPEKFTAYLLSQATERVPADLIQDFCDKNAKAQAVWPELQKRLPVRFLSHDQMESLFSVGPPDRPDGWDRFYAKYPKSPGIITISRVGFNRRGDLAMVYVGWQSHWLAGGGRIYVLRKQAGQWVEEPVLIGPSWVS
jgi:hypothetical protein